MSYTEIYAFGKDGKVLYSDETKNSHLGANRVWTELEKKYLPSLPEPIWASALNDKREYWSRVYLPPSSDNNKSGTIKEVWDLWLNKRLSKTELICLGTTFDKVLVKIENVPEVIEAFRNIEIECSSLPEQADKIEEMIKDNDVIAIGWNQTSVNGDNWSNFNYDPESEESESYNLFEQDEHWFLFEGHPELK